ncbi:hypothetical protein CBM2633_B40003 [Cupriavidus taiwanensis]|nr:hypothetical protein CBM2633_B40003 [Cupriavidus taiwanensis]
MRLLDKLLGRFTLEARQGNLQFDLDAEALRDRTDADRALDRCIGGHVDLLLAGDIAHRTQEAGRIAGSKQLLRIQAVAGTTHFLGHRQLGVELAVGRGGTAIAAAGGGGMSGIYDFLEFHLRLRFGCPQGRHH